MTDPLVALSDADAERLLIAVARARGGATKPLEATAELREALARESGAMAGQAISPGELARLSLLLLAEDPASRRAIEAMAEQPPESPQRFDAGASVALTAAVLFALQTEIDIQRGKDGKWSFKFKKSGEQRAGKAVDGEAGVVPRVVRPA